MIRPARWALVLHLMAVGAAGCGDNLDGPQDAGLVAADATSDAVVDASDTADAPTCPADRDATCALALGPAFALTDPALGPARSRSPQITRGDHQILIVWTDETIDAYGDVLARLIDDDGTTRDVTIAAGDGFQVGGAAAFDGTRYMVTFGEGVLDAHPASYSAVFVTATGDVSPPMAIASDPAIGPMPALAAANGVFLVTYGLYDVNWQIHGVTIDAAGNVNPIGLLAATGYAQRLASDGTSFLMTWWDLQSDLVAYRRFDTDGQPLGTTHYPHAESETESVTDRDPSVAFAGGQYVIGFIGAVFDGMAWGLPEILAMRVDPTGTVLDSAAIPIATVGDVSRTETIAVGNDVAVFWHDRCCDDVHKHVYGARVRGDATVLDPGGVTLTTEEFVDAGLYGVAARTNDYVLAYGAPFDPTISTTPVVWTRTVSDELVPNAPTLLSMTPVAQGGARLIPGTAMSLVAWPDARSGRSQLYAGRVDGSGAHLDGTGMLIAGALATQDQLVAAGTPDATLVVWQEVQLVGGQSRYGLRAAWLAATATGVTSTAFDLVGTGTDLVTHPAVVAMGTRFFVTWLAGSGGSPVLRGAVLDVGDTTQAVVTHTIDSSVTLSWWSPAVAASASGFVVAYLDLASGTPDLHVRRVDSDGVAIDVTPLVVANLGGYAYVAVATRGSEALVSYNASGALRLAHIGEAPFAVTAVETLVAGSVTPRSMIVRPSGSILVAWSESQGIATSAFVAQQCTPGTPAIAHNVGEASAYFPSVSFTADGAFAVYTYGNAAVLPRPFALHVDTEACASPTNSGAAHDDTFSGCGCRATRPGDETGVIVGLGIMCVLTRRRRSRLHRAVNARARSHHYDPI